MFSTGAGSPGTFQGMLACLVGMGFWGGGGVYVCWGAREGSRGEKKGQDGTPPWSIVDPNDCFAHLPAAPGLGEVLHDGARLVLAHALGHHVEDVRHHRRAQLQVEVRLRPVRWWFTLDGWGLVGWGKIQSVYVCVVGVGVLQAARSGMTDT